MCIHVIVFLSGNVQLLYQLNEAEKKSVVQMLKAFLKGCRAPDHNMSVEQYNKEIDDAIACVQAGDFYTQEQVEKMAKDF